MSLSKSESEVSRFNEYGATARRASWKYLLAKRAIDIVGAAIGLLALSPILLVIVILIKSENPKAPVVFCQTRIGRGERPFRMYKFRSMVPNAEELLADLLRRNEVSGAMFKMKDDPRITRVGRFIRRTSIDELPQLWNVIRGEMSLVGPRPPLPNEVDAYTDYDKQRLSVKPGCTGLWQVSGRNSVGFKEMVELDLNYIRSRNLWLDLKIIARTGRALIGSRDAF